MTATFSNPDLDRRFEPRDRKRFVPRLSLRRRSADHPMVMFSIVAAVALTTMAFVPTSGPVLVSFNEPTNITEGVQTTEKTSRLPQRETDIACRGQAWGAESETCLAQIAKEAGKNENFRVRKLAAAEPLSSTPNIF